MVFAGVSIAAEDAEALLLRFKDVTALRGEMKGSRISLPERGLFFELLERFRGRAFVSELVPNGAAGRTDRDLRAYAALLGDVVMAWLPMIGERPEILIDDGRYDPSTLSLVSAEIASLIGKCGRTRLADSHRSAGIQIADVIANSVFNLVRDTPRTERVRRIVAPFIASGTLQVRQLAEPIAA
jgi:hypothetical protein